MLRAEPLRILREHEATCNDRVMGNDIVIDSVSIGIIGSISKREIQLINATVKALVRTMRLERSVEQLSRAIKVLADKTLGDDVIDPGPLPPFEPTARIEEFLRETFPDLQFSVTHSER